jgi:hypothetical protein
LGIDLNDNQNELVQTCYEMLLDNTYTDKCINVGKYIYRYLLSEYKLASRKIYEINWNDYNCLLINSSFKGSTQFEQYENYKDYDIMISWSFTGNSFQYGLYTTKPYINVGELAATFLNGRWTYGRCRRRKKRVYFSQIIKLKILKETENFRFPFLIILLYFNINMFTFCIIQICKNIVILINIKTNYTQIKPNGEKQMRTRSVTKETPVNLEIVNQFTDNNTVMTETSSDFGKSFDELVIENEKFVYSVVNNEFKNYPWNVKEELYSAGKLRTCIRCN